MIRILTAAAIALTATIAQASERWKEIPPEAAMPEARESGMAQVNGIEMYYAIYGDGAGVPILMIHGGLAHGDIWGAQVADLMADYTVIVADTRGHGRSTNDGSAYGYELLADDYLDLMDHLGIEKVHLVGWSDGANIGYSISQTNPDRLASHFAHAGNVTLDGIDPTVETNPVFGAYVGMMAEDYGAMSSTPDGFEAFLGGVATMWGTEKPGGVEALKAISVPTLVVQSEHDEAILMAHSELIAGSIPGADLLVLENTSHFSSFQAPDEYTAAIRAFLSK
ncbi:MAG: alpha/beta fold hydrolase [Rhodobacteraceae bacterium]|nr:alpha/beta fold hydrolase [Paracoccaceae bacterium]